MAPTIKPSLLKPSPINQHKRLAMGKPVPKPTKPKGLNNV